MKKIDGNNLAQKILNKVKKEIKKLPTPPGLAVILVGNNPASKIYIKKKEKTCIEVGIHFEKFIFEKTTNKKLLNLIKNLNRRDNINGILVQFPLPKYLEANEIIKAINIDKDVDGFLPKSKVQPPTVSGILELIKSTKINLKNKTALILTNNEIFAKPLKKLLEKNGLKVRILIKPNAQKFNADIVISALGKPKFITANMIKNDTTIIDVGITRVGKKIYGDVDQESLKDKNVWLTPVPGGVGPMTVAMLIKNVLILTKTKK